MAGRVQPSPLGGSTSAEEATSAVLSLSRLKKRRVKSRLRFNESVVRHQYSYGNLETGEAGEELSTSEEALKEHSDLSGWIHLWCVAFNYISLVTQGARQERVARGEPRVHRAEYE